MDLIRFAEEVGAEDRGPVTICGGRTREGPVPDVRCVRAPAGIDWVQADEMVASCGAATPVDDLQAALAEVGQRIVLPPGGTVGGALAHGVDGIRRLGDGPLRDVLLQARYVSASGQVVRAGGPTVKNVSGFDLCRVLVGSRGTLGFLGDVIVRTRPIAPTSRWFKVETDDPVPTFACLHRPVSVLWDGSHVWALLEGHPDDLAEQAASAALIPIDAPSLPAWFDSAVLTALRPAQVPELSDVPGSFVAEVGVGTVHRPPDDPAHPLGSHADRGSSGPLVTPDGQRAAAELAARVKRELDPTGRLNPGR